MKTRGLILLLSSLSTSLMAGAPNQPAVIPLPQRMELRAGTFELGTGTMIIADTMARTSAEHLAKRLRLVTGYSFPVGTRAEEKQNHDVILLTSQDANAALGAEGYDLFVSGHSVIIRATGSAGFFYGAQTLLQLLPPEVFAGKPVQGVNWTIPSVQIADQPRFPWRGMMLDVGRHFLEVADVKRLLDLMALHKLNTFHWHLTDDQGWRIEIKKYPKLTEIGAWRESSPPYGNRHSDDGQRHGGFYTQAQIKDIVAYAAALHITIVPEIEMPGHASAAITSYPQFGNDDIAAFAPRVVTRWGVQPYTFAPKEETFHFLEDVLTEVCELFPSRFIHIGGDEAPKTQWKQSKLAQEVMRREQLGNEDELQSWFVRRIATFLASKNRRMIGWDEIQEGGLPKTATLMVWRDAKWAKHALALGNAVVMATTTQTYLDYYQAPKDSELAKGKEFETIGGFLPIEKVYAYDPCSVTETPAQARLVLGTQGQLWGEYVKDLQKAEYMAYPRLTALAEVAWSSQAARNYDDFTQRLQMHYRRLDQLGVNYHHPAAANTIANPPK